MDQYEVWKRPGVVDDYARESHLQPPEETILGALIRDLHNVDMLDIGVGGGRTTVHFAKLCRRYVGTDISEGMLAACRRRFANWPESVSFQLSDATSMPQFRDGEFDVVMFSFNGIDCLGPEGRLAALREISRVLKPGGVFIFSAHNTRALPKRMSLTRHFTLHPVNLLRGLKSWVQLNYIYNSPAKLKRALAAPFCTVHDGSYRVRLRALLHQAGGATRATAALLPRGTRARALERGAARRKSAGDDGFEVGVLLLQEAGLGALEDPRYFRPSFLPFASRPTASRSRRSLVSSRFAESIQPMYFRRYDGASCSKCRQAAPLSFNARSMYFRSAHPCAACGKRARSRSRSRGASKPRMPRRTRADVERCDGLGGHAGRVEVRGLPREPPCDGNRDDERAELDEQQARALVPQALADEFGFLAAHRLG